MPANFMVRSQVPTCFLRTSCSGPGWGGSWVRATEVATAMARATAQNQRTVFIETLHQEGGAALEAPRPQAASRRVQSGRGRWDAHSHNVHGPRMGTVKGRKVVRPEQWEGLYFGGGRSGSS